MGWRVVLSWLGALAIAGCAGADADTAGERDAGGRGAGGSGGVTLSAADCVAGGPGFEALRAAAMRAQPGVDLHGLDSAMVHRVAFSAYVDATYHFKVPLWLDGVGASDVSQWAVYPAGAARVEPDGRTGGVVVTIQAPCEQVAVSYASGAVGAMAELQVALGEPELYLDGQARFNRGAEWSPAAVDEGGKPLGFDDVPADAACTECHTSGGRRMQVVNTPMQTAGYSGDALDALVTQGQMPGEPPCFHVLTQAEQGSFAHFHAFTLTAAQKAGLRLYLRSLSPRARTGDGAGAPAGECLR